MIAGLPKPTMLLLLSAGVAMGLATFGFGQDVQPTSQIPESIVTLVESNPAVSENNAALLLSAIDAALTEGTLTDDEVLDLLEQFSWSTLVNPDELADGLNALLAVLDGLNSGEIVEDPGADRPGTSGSPQGIENALARAGADAETLHRAGELIDNGLPPGIVLHVARDALRQGTDPSAGLDLLAQSYAEGNPPGQAANEAIGRGSYAYRDRESNRNRAEGGLSDPQDGEEERNQHGVASGSSQAKPGNGKGNPKG